MTYQGTPLVVEHPNPKFSLCEERVVQRVKFNVNLKWCDPVAVDPSYAQQFESIRRRVLDFEMYNAVRPPTAEIVRAVCDALADVPFEQSVDLLNDGPIIRDDPFGVIATQEQASQ